MPLTGAQKQVRSRGRHLVNGTKAALHLFVSASARAKIIRLAHHRGCTMTALVEELATRAEHRVTAQLSDKALKAYYDNE
jgi:hypothetical protein